MTFFFNFDKAKELGKNDPLKVISLLKDLYEGRILKYGVKTKLSNKAYSYLLNPRGIFQENAVDVLYKYQYLILASRRDYTLYSLYGIKNLPLAYYPEINPDSIKHNPLLYVTNTEIHFKYEEI
jgi:hypothetical protein